MASSNGPWQSLPSTTSSQEVETNPRNMLLSWHSHLLQTHTTCHPWPHATPASTASRGWWTSTTTTSCPAATTLPTVTSPTTPLQLPPLQPQFLLQGSALPGLQPVLQQHPVIDMILNDPNTRPQCTTLLPRDEQMVQLLTKSIAHLMDQTPSPGQHQAALQTDLDDAFPKQCVPITGIDKTNLQSWSGLSVNDYLPPFWTAFTKAKTNGSKLFVLN